MRLPIPAASLSRPQLSPLPRASLLVLASTLGLAIILVTYWPGWVSPDSIYQLQQARSGVFTDGHPPLMAWVWRWLDLAWPGPQGMLVLQNALFWGGLALACGIWIQSAVGAAVVLLIGLSPACFSNLGTVWKDIQMGAALLAAFALLSKYRMDKNRVALGGSALCLCYACAVRHNGIVTAAPLVSWLAWLVTRRAPECRRRLYTVALAAALLVGIGVTVRGVDGELTHGRSLHLEQQAIVHDLVALSVATGTNLFPEPWRSGPSAVSLEEMRSLYLPESVNPLYSTSGPHFDIVTSPSDLLALERTWARALFGHPGAYLRHRWLLFSRLLALRGYGVYYPFAESAYLDDLQVAAVGVRYHWTPWDKFVHRALLRVHNWVFFRGWCSLLAIVIVLALAWRRKPEGLDAALALGASGILNVAPYFVFGPAPDFRYLWWTAIVALVLPAVVWGKGFCGSAAGAR